MAVQVVHPRLTGAAVPDKQLAVGSCGGKTEKEARVRAVSKCSSLDKRSGLFSSLPLPPSLPTDQIRK